jgi:hypothetical protein
MSGAVIVARGGENKSSGGGDFPIPSACHSSVGAANIVPAARGPNGPPPQSGSGRLFVPTVTAFIVTDRLGLPARLADGDSRHGAGVVLE